MGLDITGMGSVADLANNVINKIWPDKSEQEKAQIAAAVQIVAGQLDINKQEASSSSMFVAGWRPYIGWVCGTALTYQYIIRPLAMWAAAIFGVALPPMPGLDDVLWQLLFGMLGLGGLRTYEKIKGASK